MSIFEHWQKQKSVLELSLTGQTDMAGVVYQVRHAILQVEQNALAEMTDDVLRQQAGILFSSIKNSVGLMEAHIATQVWVPQKQRSSRREPFSLRIIAAAMLAALVVYCYVKGLWLGCILTVCSLILGLVSSLHSSKVSFVQDETRITLKPDPDRMFAILDGQMKAIDRYVNDFSYLNDQQRSGTEGADPAALSCAADLLEALYEYDEEEREPAEDAARRLLSSMGLCAVDYSCETSRLFNALPSKNITRTLSPAIISAHDRSLLRRGTAAVKMEAVTAKESA